MSKTIEVFVSYSHQDQTLVDKLLAHLRALQWQGEIQEWYDREIEAGADWERAIVSHLDSADMILLVISPAFLASDYSFEEAQRAIERHEAGTARVIPILLKPCDWQATPFRMFQVLPRDAKPITQWPDRDEAFLNVAIEIRAVARRLISEQHPQETSF